MDSRQEDTIYCGASARSEDIFYEGSEDEKYHCFQARKRHYELAARRFLDGDAPFILSATLKGPFDLGWTNPWCSGSSHRRGRQPLSSVTGNSLVQTVNREKGEKFRKESYLPSPESLKQAASDTEQHQYLESNKVSQVHKWREHVQHQAVDPNNFWTPAVRVADKGYKKRKRARSEGWLKRQDSKRHKPNGTSAPKKRPRGSSNRPQPPQNRDTNASTPLSDEQQLQCRDQPVSFATPHRQKSWSPPKGGDDPADELIAIGDTSPSGAAGHRTPSVKRTSPKGRFGRQLSSPVDESEDELSVNQRAAATITTPTSQLKCVRRASASSSGGWNASSEGKSNARRVARDTSPSPPQLSSRLSLHFSTRSGAAQPVTDLPMTTDDTEPETVPVWTEIHVRGSDEEEDLENLEASSVSSLSSLEENTDCEVAVQTPAAFKESIEVKTMDQVSAVEEEASEIGSSSSLSSLHERSSILAPQMEAMVPSKGSDDQQTVSDLDDDAQSSSSLSSGFSRSSALVGAFGTLNTHLLMTEQEEPVAGEDGYLAATGNDAGTATSLSSVATDDSKSWSGLSDSVEGRVEEQRTLAENENCVVQRALSPAHVPDATKDCKNEDEEAYDIHGENFQSSTPLGENISPLLSAQLMDCQPLSHEAGEYSEAALLHDNTREARLTASESPAELLQPALEQVECQIRAPLERHPAIIDGDDSTQNDTTRSRQVTPEVQFGVKSFASFMSPSPIRPSKSWTSNTYALPEGCHSILKSNFRACTPQIKKHVSWAPIPTEETATSSVPESGNGPHRATSPPPAVPIADDATAEDAKFSSHFNVVVKQCNAGEHVRSGYTTLPIEGMSGTDATGSGRAHLGYEGSDSASDVDLDEPESADNVDGGGDSQSSLKDLDSIFDEMGDVLMAWDVDAELDEARKQTTQDYGSIGIW